MSARRPRILFVAEAVTLAHVARPMVLLQRLDPARFDVSIATSDRYDRLFADVNAPRHRIQCTQPEVFLRRLASGAPLFDARTLRLNVTEDLELLQAVRPDLVIGDLRLSLAVSARLARVPFATVTNAYWSPYAVLGPDGLRLEVPEIAMTRLLGPAAAQTAFDLIAPLAFAVHCLPMRRTRRAFALRGGPDAPGWDVREVYSDADFVLYADAPGSVRMHNDLPPSHHFIGPLPWSPKVPPPAWWDDAVRQPHPKVYLTLGSSGRADLVPMVMQALDGLGVTVLAATAGRLDVPQAPSNAFVADYLPGDAAAAAADLVVCNGGSPTTQQAVAAGKPVLALPANMDQFLNMQSILRAGAGLVIRPCQADPPSIRMAVSRLLDERMFRDAAERWRDKQADAAAGLDFQAIVERMLATSAGQPAKGPMQMNRGETRAGADLARLGVGL